MSVWWRELQTRRMTPVWPLSSPHPLSSQHPGNQCPRANSSHAFNACWKTFLTWSHTTTLNQPVTVLPSAMMTSRNMMTKTLWSTTCWRLPLDLVTTQMGLCQSEREGQAFVLWPLYSKNVSFPIQLMHTSNFGLTTSAPVPRNFTPKWGKRSGYHHYKQIKWAYLGHSYLKFRLQYEAKGSFQRMWKSRQTS